MRLSARAFQAVALLIGFYLLSFGVLAALVLLDVLMYKVVSDQPNALRVFVMLLLVTGTAFLVVGRAIFVSTRVKREDLPGVPVTPEQQPVLWERVRYLAREAGTRPPKEIRIVPQVNAAVTENARLLGLIPGRRILMIGAPLLLAFTTGQLDAVLAHEFGHYSNRDTRLLPVVNRGRVSLMAALNAARGEIRGPRGKASGRKAGQGQGSANGRIGLPGQELLFKLFRAYAFRYFAVTEAISRAQEYAADRISVRIAGPDSAASALAELPALDAAYGFYLDRFVAAGLPDKLLPRPELALAGFAGLLAEPERQAQIAKVRANPPVRKPDRFDSHPPLPDRIAAIRALPWHTPADLSAPAGSGTVPDPGSRAVDLLADPEALFAAVAADMLAHRAEGTTAADWDEIAAAVARRATVRSAGPLRLAVSELAQPAKGLGALLDLADAGRLGEVLDLLPRGDAAKKATGRVAREFAKNEVADRLPDWIYAELTANGRRVWGSSWAHVVEVRLEPALVKELADAVDALLAVHTDAAPLRAVLTREAIVS